MYFYLSKAICSISFVISIKSTSLKRQVLCYNQNLINSPSYFPNYFFLALIGTIKVNLTARTLKNSKILLIFISPSSQSSTGSQKPFLNLILNKVSSIKKAQKYSTFLLKIFSSCNFSN